MSAGQRAADGATAPTDDLARRQELVRYLETEAAVLDALGWTSRDDFQSLACARDARILREAAAEIRLLIGMS